MTPPDGRLTDEIVPEDRPPRDACGVFGVWAPHEDVANLAYYGLYALQHRGQESAGIAVSDGNRIMVHKEMGLVAQVFDEPALTALRGHIAVGHCRYSTTGASTWANAQPTFRSTGTVSLALGHNGNLINTRELAALLDGAGPGSTGIVATSDTDVLTALFLSDHARPEDGRPDRSAQPGQPRSASRARWRPRRRRCCRWSRARTRWSSWTSRPCTRRGIRRASGRSCWAAWTPAGWSRARRPRWTSWEPGSCARSRRASWSASTGAGCGPGPSPRRKPSGCLFEYVYLARPDTTISGRGVHATRVAVGRRLAAEHPADADLVIPVPESGTPAAIGFAEASGIPFGQGLVKNSYVGRTFIQPSQTIRERGIKLKLNPLRDAIAGRRLVVVDDTIVRGTTQRALVAMLREAGASEVHVRVAAPPVRWPCFYGIDFATRAELIAGQLSPEEICTSIGADSLGYVSLAGLIEATTLPESRLCRACFDGQYPVPVAEDDRGKHVLDGLGVGS